MLAPNSPLGTKAPLSPFPGQPHPPASFSNPYQASTRRIGGQPLNCRHSAMAVGSSLDQPIRRNATFACANRSASVVLNTNSASVAIDAKGIRRQTADFADNTDVIRGIREISGQGKDRKSRFPMQITMSLAEA